jgi:alpha-methylacyl-CoA racemase
VTGWGQDGRLAQAAGQDINYVACSGVLGAIGRHGQIPVPPLNLVGDYGGGAMLLAPGPVRWWMQPWWTAPPWRWPSSTG